MENYPIKIKGVSIRLLDNRKFISYSYGEVKEPYTLDASTLTPILNGLMCERIFGPVENMVCACGKRYYNKEKGKKCPVCSIEANNPVVRRHRSGHIALESPVLHPWFRKIISTYLNIPPKKLDQLVLCSLFMVKTPGKSGFQREDIITDATYFKYLTENRNDAYFIALTGGELMEWLLARFDVEAEINRLRKVKPSRRNNKRLLLLRNLKNSGGNPQDAVIRILPVLPAGLRPVLALENGTLVSSDLNDLYARVIIHNNRLRKLKEIKAPKLLQNLQRKSLQHSVDCLMDKKYVAKNRTGKKILKPLLSYIESKNGRLRRNLLGKRVDYSGRSVIVVGPHLKMNQFGIPIYMAIEILRPFIYSRLLRTGLSYSMRHAMMLCDMQNEAAIDALEEVIKDKVLILNRAPSLHKMSLQAFYPVLINEKALRLHPLTCSAFNADFDGDQMGVHLPVTDEAQKEAKELMISSKNILSPANGKVSMSPSQDMVLGLYYLTKEDINAKGAGKIFSDAEEVLIAYDHEVVELHAPVKVRIGGAKIDTTPGRIIFSQIFPEDIPFCELNINARKKDLGRLIDMVYEKDSEEETLLLLDRLKDEGFRYAMLSGTSLCMDDITIPREKNAIIENTEKLVRSLKDDFEAGLMDEKEKYNKTIELWMKTNETITDAMMENFGVCDDGLTNEEKNNIKQFNSVFMMADSGARGSKDQLRQLAGMRGLMAKPNGDIVEMPIKSNFKEGLSCYEFFLSCHGARKGRADGALKTANAGYFTRRLVDAACDVIINSEDCETDKSFTIHPLTDNNEIIIDLKERITGRVSAESIKHPISGDILIEKNHIITKDKASLISKCGITSVKVRSPICCELQHGVCSMCYGVDLVTKRLPEIGDAVGVIAAQSIGEPGTQLTLRTFHSGGSASGRGHKNTIEAKEDGEVIFKDVATVFNKEGSEVVVNRNAMLYLKVEGIKKAAGLLPYGSVLQVHEGQLVKAGDKLAQWDSFSMPIISTNSGEATYENIIKNITTREETDQFTGVSRVFITTILPQKIPQIIIGDNKYQLPVGVMLVAKEGQFINAGDVIAKLPKQAVKNVDITGGLSRVLDILEARKPKTPALMVEVDGQMQINPPEGGFLQVDIIKGSEVMNSYRVSVSQQLNFLNGDQVKAGDLLFDGSIDIRDVLNIKGPEAAAAYIIDEVQKVYRMQGVNTDDKHLEIIVAKMLSRMKITNPGNTDFVTDEMVTWHKFDLANEQTSGVKANAAPVLMGLTRVSLEAESWLSAASFQNTKDVLSKAAFRKKTDFLRGPKENIIIGAPIPIGTGHPSKAGPDWNRNKMTKKEKKRLEALEKLKELFG